MSEQLAIDFVSAPAFRQVGRREYVLRRALEETDKFRPDFYEWLKANLHIWEAFEREANAVYALGQTHWSARTIGEYLRHQTRLRAVGDEPFKISDWWWPHLARLYGVMYPERADFFEIRRRAA